ncbi:hypothetical protein Shyhy01_44530 [Streptomyces hygroscopicus subsp. hygroscopicus]|nr:hypothetical protein Shyhy01_44530 [Streptomyces hygroscopicus subsp. hygroscopicus]
MDMGRTLHTVYTRCVYMAAAGRSPVIRFPAPSNPGPPVTVGSLGTGADSHVRKRVDRLPFVIEAGVSFRS